MKVKKPCALLLAVIPTLGLSSCGIDGSGKYEKAVRNGRYSEAIANFEALEDYEDSAERAAAYETKYAKAVSKREAGKFDAAIALFKELGAYSDSAAQVEEARNAKTYAEGVALMADEKYNETIEVFKQLGTYRDSEEWVTKCTYQTAEKLRKKQQYAKAYAIYAAIRGYKNVDEILKSDAGIAKAAAYQPGNYVTFGTYPQTTSGTDDTPIEWLKDRSLDGMNLIVGDKCP